MTKRAPKIPPEARKVTVETSRGMFGREGPIQIHAIAFDPRDPYFAPVEMKSKAAATNLLKRLGFVKVGRPSPYSGSQEWHRLTPEEVAALPRAESPRELRARWRGNPTKARKEIPRHSAIAFPDPRAERLARCYENFEWIAKIAPEGMGDLRGVMGHVPRLPEPTALDVVNALNAVESIENIARTLRSDLDTQRKSDRKFEAAGVRVGGEVVGNPARRRPRVRRVTRAQKSAMLRRAAARVATKNPEIVPLAYDPPMPGVKPPRRLALLAELVELVVTTPNGEQRTIRPKPNTAAMLTNSTGDVLWFVWPTKAKRVPMPPGARREKKIFETWSKHKASVALNFSTGEAAWPYEPLGVVRVVRYRSDKWTGEPTLYEHEFTSRGVKAFGDKVKNPKLIVASIPTFDQRQAVTLVTSRGLVG